MSKAFAIAGANLRRFLRERSNLFFVFVFPLGLVLLIGLTFGGGPQSRVGVVAGDGPLGSELREGLAALEGFEVAHVADEATLRERVERGALFGGVVLSEGAEAALREGREVRVALVAPPDGSAARLRQPVEAALAAPSRHARAARAVARWSDSGLDEARARVEAADADAPRITVRATRVGESAFGTDLGTFDLGAPSQLILFMFLTGLTASAALIQSRTLGVSRRMTATPTATATLVAGEALGRFAVVACQGLYILLATLVIFGVDWGDPWGALALLAAFAAVGAGAGLLLGATFDDDQQASGIGVVLGLGLAALGGCMTPLELYGPTFRAVAHVTPHAWAIDGYAELVRRGGGIGDVWVELAVLLGFAALLWALASWRLGRVLASH